TPAVQVGQQPRSPILRLSNSPAPSTRQPGQTRTNGTAEPVGALHCSFLVQFLPRPRTVDDECFRPITTRLALFYLFEKYDSNLAANLLPSAVRRSFVSLPGPDAVHPLAPVTDFHPLPAGQHRLGLWVARVHQKRPVSIG